MRRVICVRTSKSGADAGWIPLMNLGPGIFCGNFIAKNNDGMVYAECINTNNQSVDIPVPEVELIRCNIITDKRSVGEDDTFKNRKILSLLSIKLLFTETAQNLPSNESENLESSHSDKIKRAEKIFSLVDKEGCNEEDSTY